MCNTKTQVDQPLTTPGSALPGGGTAGAGPANGDPLSSAIQSEAAANPKTASVTSPTKFGKLLSFVAPLAEGALVGGFGGRGHAGGGFGAATDYFNAKKDRALRQKQFDQQQENANILNRQRQAMADLEAARTTATINKPNFTGGRVTSAQDASGKRVLLRQNPITGVDEPIEGFSPLDTPDKNQVVTNDEGIYSVNANDATARPVTVGGAPPQSNPVGPNPVGPGKFGGATASPSLVKSGTGIPTNAPGQQLKGKQPAEKTPNDFEQFYQSYLDDHGLQDNSKNRLNARAQYSAAERKPDNGDEDGTLKGKAYVKRQSSYLDQLNRGFAASEQQRQRDLDAIEKGTSTKTTEEVEQENADRKQTLHQRLVDAAEGQGIDLGSVPDYHAQLSGGASAAAAPAQGVPRTAPTGQSDKVASPDVVAAWAKKKGISVGAAQKQFKAKGYKLTQ